MKLVDFGLDLPYVEDERRIELIQHDNKLAREESIKQDYKINWDEKRRKFSHETRCITAFFARLLIGYKTKDCKKRKR